MDELQEDQIRRTISTAHNNNEMFLHFWLPADAGLFGTKHNRLRQFAAFAVMMSGVIWTTVNSSAEVSQDSNTYRIFGWYSSCGVLSHISYNRSRVLEDVAERFSRLALGCGDWT